MTKYFLALSSIFLIAVDGYIIYCGSQFIGTMVLLTSLVLMSSLLFWYLRFGDSQFYFKKNPSGLLVAGFLGTMTYFGLEAWTPTTTMPDWQSASVSQASIEFFGIWISLGLLFVVAMVIVTSLKRST